MNPVRDNVDSSANWINTALYLTCHINYHLIKISNG